jgi:two-component system chemotaxis response regulator CheY
MRVLLVEDVDDLRETFAWLLRYTGCKVLEAASGPEALQALNGFKPDLVFTDYNMPEMSGIELIRRLRVLPGLDHVPILMVTAIELEEVQEQALKAGAAGVVTKPVDVLDLLDRFERGEFGEAETGGVGE